MDFLDPKKRRAYHIRLYLGYFLVAIVIALATYIITAGLNGYGLNVKTGQVVQNGLLFVDSKPGAAEIYLNGKDQNATTSARLILPAGNYTLTLKRNGYRDWSRSFRLNEESVDRYQYAFLFPETPRSTDLKTYTVNPPLITQSPDQKWLLLENSAASAQAPTFDEYDTTTLDKTTPAVTSVAFPSDLLTNYTASSVLTAVEWSTDNANVLIKHDYAGGTEFVVFNRAHPDQSYNVNRTFSITPTKVNLYNKSAAKLYIYNQADGSLSLADIGAKTVASPVLTHVLSFQVYGKNLINYITDNNQPAGQVAAKIWDNGHIYTLNQFPAGSIYLIEAAQYQGDFYYADGSDKSDRIALFKNPEDSLKDPSIAKALPFAALNAPGATWLKFSNNARFIGAEAGQHFAVYDLETQSRYEYDLANPLAASMNWMDGHRLIGQSKGNIFVMDYDSTNQQTIVPSALATGGLFSSDYNHLLTIASSSDGTTFVLKDVDMRAGVDLPKK